MEAIARAFRDTYEERYAQADQAPIEIVSFRVVGVGAADRSALPERAAGGSAADARIAVRPVLFAGEALDTPIFRRDGLSAGEDLAGPAIIEEDGATTVVPPGFAARLDHYGIMILTRTNPAAVP
jgi:N-methylhydantoinase A